MIGNITYFRVLLILLCFSLLACCNDDTPENPSGNLRSLEALGGSLNERAEAIISTSDGGYAVLGYTQSADGDITDKNNTSFDYWLLKYSSTHQLQWQKTFGGSADDRGKSIVETNDGGYAILGSSNSSDGDVSENNGQLDFWLVRLNSGGNILWERSFGFAGNDEGMALTATTDLGFLITGVLDVTASGGEGNSRQSQRHAGGDYWAVKVSPGGDLEWSRYYGGNFTDTPEGVVQLADGGYIIAGGSDSLDTDISNNLGTYDFWVIRISATGDLIWDRNFGGTEIDEARALVATDDGNILVVGDTRSTDVMVSNNYGGADVWLIKITPDGDLLWERNYGGSDFDSAQDIKRTEGGYLISGSSRSSNIDLSENKGQNDMWILKINVQGEIIWQKSLGGSNIDFGYAVSKIDDGTVVSVGDSNSDDGDLMENKGFTDLIIAQIND